MGEFIFFPNINLNWIPLTTVLNCAQQERLERRTRVCGSFWRLGAGGRRDRTRGYRLFPTTTCPPLAAGRDGNLGMAPALVSRKEVTSRGQGGQAPCDVGQQ